MLVSRKKAGAINGMTEPPESRVRRSLSLVLNYGIQIGNRQGGRMEHDLTYWNAEE